MARLLREPVQRRHQPLSMDYKAQLLRPKQLIFKWWHGIRIDEWNIKPFISN
jgi:hypothetical protein